MVKVIKTGEKNGIAEVEHVGSGINIIKITDPEKQKAKTKPLVRTKPAKRMGKSERLVRPRGGWKA